MNHASRMIPISLTCLTLMNQLIGITAERLLGTQERRNRRRRQEAMRTRIESLDYTLSQVINRQRQLERNTLQFRDQLQAELDHVQRQPRFHTLRAEETTPEPEPENPYGTIADVRETYEQVRVAADQHVRITDEVREQMATQMRQHLAFDIGMGTAPRHLERRYPGEEQRDTGNPYRPRE